MDLDDRRRGERLLLDARDWPGGGIGVHPPAKATQIDVISSGHGRPSTVVLMQAEPQKREGRRTKIIATVGPASWDPPVLGAADRSRRRCLQAQLLPRRPRSPRGDDRSDPQRLREGRARRRGSRRPARPEAPDRRAPQRRRRARDRHPREAHPGGSRGRQRDDPDRLAGPLLAARGRARLPRRRRDPPPGERARDRRRGGRMRGRGGRDALLPQGDERPRRDRAGDDRRRPGLGRVRGRARHRPACGLLRLDRRRPRPGRRSGCARSTPTSR